MSGGRLGPLLPIVTRPRRIRRLVVTDPPGGSKTTKPRRLSDRAIREAAPVERGMYRKITAKSQTQFRRGQFFNNRHRSRVGAVLPVRQCKRQL